MILTMHDVSLKPTDVKAIANGQLLLEGTVKTYRYVEDDEESGAKAPPPRPGAPGAKQGGQ